MVGRLSLCVLPLALNMFQAFFGDAPPNAERRRALQVLGVGGVLGVGALAARELGQQKRQRMALHAQAPAPVHVPVPERRAPERIRINPHEPTFNRLRERGVFAPEQKWAITADAEAFYEIGRSFVHNPETAALRQEQELRILVPAAGVLLSQLELAFQLAEASTTLERVTFTFTEIDQASFDAFDRHVASLVRACENLENPRLSIEPHPELASGPDSHPAQKNLLFDYLTEDGRSVAVRIEYELAMSGDRYFRPQAAADADIVILHDIERSTDDGSFPATNEAGDLHTILADVPPRRMRGKKQYAVIDAPVAGYRHTGRAIGTVVGTVADERYGCGENHLDRNSREQLHLDRPREEGHVVEIIEVDQELPRQLRRHGGERLVQAYGRLLIPLEFESAWVEQGSDGSRASVELLRHHLPMMGSPRVKETIRMAALELLAYFATNTDGMSEADHAQYYRDRRAALEPLIRQSRTESE